MGPYLTLLSGITRVILCSGNHDLDERSPEGEKMSRWVGEVRDVRYCLRWGEREDLRHALHGLSLVGRAARQGAHRMPAAPSRSKTAGSLGLGSPCTAGEFARELGR